MPIDVANLSVNLGNSLLNEILLPAQLIVIEKLFTLTNTVVFPALFPDTITVIGRAIEYGALLKTFAPQIAIGYDTRFRAILAVTLNDAGIIAILPIAIADLLPVGDTSLVWAHGCTGR
ncbi:hypothetical protein ATY37_05695 [Vibrio cidicii]|uniref:Uncharacterized protein n=1 Tax=Vibrio cidicii TaxID=1763883 RepID=A0A151KUA3_9VIBR|nr:hypothetical protein ATY37_05695 [Vibrio cidicii]